MSSNIRLKKVCQHCQQHFSAKTTVTKFCSDDCAKRNYKKRAREQKITKSILEANKKLANSSAKETPVPAVSSGVDRLQREWLNIQDISMLLGIAERTLFRTLKKGGLPRIKIGRRLLFNRQRVLDYFISKSEGYEG